MEELPEFHVVLLLVVESIPVFRVPGDVRTEIRRGRSRRRQWLGLVAHVLFPPEVAHSGSHHQPSRWMVT